MVVITIFVVRKRNKLFANTGEPTQHSERAQNMYSSIHGGNYHNEKFNN